MSTFFKNTELARLYGVSEATVRNWVKSTKEGKLKLELASHDGRSYVAKSIRNISIVERLIKQNRKYRNTLAVKPITASQKLFDVYSEAEVYDIVRNIELHHEIPHQYVYFEAGVPEWAEYARRQMTASTPNTLTRTIELLEDSFEYIDRHLVGFTKINIIDIGVGDASPVKGLIEHLIEQGKMGRYIGIDFSEGMLGLAQTRLEEWFGDKVRFEGHKRDISHERFTDIIAGDYVDRDTDSVNLVLLLGATPCNFRNRDDAFRVVCESLNQDDLFIYTDKLEPRNAPPEWLELEARHAKPEISRQHRIVLEFIGVDESLYDFEIGFDAQSGYRFARAVMKTALTLRFAFGGGERVINLEKGDSLILWRCWQTTPHSLVHLLEDNGFYILQNSHSEDRMYALTIAEVARDPSVSL